MRIIVIGSGFVGRATGKGLAKHGNKVHFLDVLPEKVEELKAEGYSVSLIEDYKDFDADISMITVPTPTTDKGISLEYLDQAVVWLGEQLKDYDKYHLAVVRSTVPPHTTREHVLPLLEKTAQKSAGSDFGLAMQPEYLRQKTAESGFERPWMITIGAHDAKAGDMLEKLYLPFDAPIERLEPEQAELQKYVHNLFNAAKIAFFNEIRQLADKLKIEVDEVFKLTAITAEGMWNPLYGVKDFGPFSGACLPKDTQAFLHWARTQDFEMTILNAVIEQNRDYASSLGDEAAAEPQDNTDMTKIKQRGRLEEHSLRGV